MTGCSGNSLTTTVTGDIDENVTVLTFLTVGTNPPEISNVSIDGDVANVVLVGNNTKNVTCVALINDWNNDTDIDSVIGEFFDNSASGYGQSDDNNQHYTTTCDINRSFGTWRGIPGLVTC